MSGKELLKKLKKDGWTLDRIKGSHHIMVKGASTVVVSVYGNSDIPKGTLNAILKQSGLK
jgi:predicted RNA binding protein YcfA (HicA-like mRNA interferase family)